MTFIRLLFVTVILAWNQLPAMAADNLDDLLHEADRALGKSSAPTQQNNLDEAQPPRKSSPKKKVKTPEQVQQEEEKSKEDAQAKEAAAIERSTLTPIDPARVSEILALDLQAQERERMTKAHRVSGRIGFANDQIPAVYQVEKDDDTFTFDAPTSLKGISLEGNRSVPLGTNVGSGVLRGSPFFGVSAGAAALQGSATIQRRGIEDEVRTYDYQIFPIDGAASFGWMTESQFSLWVSVGYAADIVRQLGTGQTDTFTATFTGETAGVGTAWRSESGYEVFAGLRQRGVIGSSSKEPTRSRVAGRMITVGIGCPI